MPFLTCLIIIPLLLFSNFSFGQNQRETGFKRLVIDVGSSPWKFKKLESQRDYDSIPFEKMNISGESIPQVKQAALKTPMRINLLKNYFSDTGVSLAFYKIEAATDSSNWTVVIDQTRNGGPVSYEFSKAVKATGNTVGYVEKKENAYISMRLNGKYRFIRLTVTKLLTSNNMPVLLSQGGLYLYGPGSISLQEKNYETTSTNDTDWEDVGIPHCFNDMDTYLNTNDSYMWHGTVWYRKHLQYDPRFAGKKIFLEFDGVNIGAAVYINGKFKPGNTAVKQPSDVTHVGGFLPFSLDITDDLVAGTDNVIAVKVSNAAHDFFTWPGFGVYENFGMGWGGIVCPVRLYALNKVHIPLDSYSPLHTWGTYNAVVDADSLSATIRLQTNVKNDDAIAHTIVLQNGITDDKNRLIKRVFIQKMIPAGATILFDTAFTVAYPQLWFPNNSPYGKPYLYKIIRTVQVDRVPVDQQSGNLGIRTITWNSNYCYINHKKHLLNGFGNRNSYPALGSAIPKEIQWKDIQLIADAGGNALRVGHVPATRQTLEACDAYGILVMDDSGDNEWSLKNEPANTYKQEYDRDMIINFRNYTSVAIWESNNGIAKDGIKYEPSKTQEIVDRWDSLLHRIVSTRDHYPAEWDKNQMIMVGYSNKFVKVPGSPSINTEVYGAFWDGRRSFNIARTDYTNEVAFSKWYVDNWLHDIDNKACGWIDWMLAETQGEGYTIYLNGMSHQRSLGSCAMDGNRFPKLKYNILKNALWHSYEARPGVTLQSNRNLSGPQTINAWSNCPQTELFLNMKSLGKRIPNTRTRQCTWQNVSFAPGTLKIVGFSQIGKAVCADSVVTAGPPHHIVLTVEKNLTAPDGSTFTVKANGSDAALIKAMIVDKDGNWCLDADNIIQFSVTGEADYKGSYNFYVIADKPPSYHSPGDTELAAEGGLMKITIRSRFNNGRITVQANSKGLVSGHTSYVINKND